MALSFARRRSSGDIRRNIGPLYFVPKRQGIVEVHFPNDRPQGGLHQILNGNSVIFHAAHGLFRGYTFMQATAFVMMTALSFVTGPHSNNFNHFFILKNLIDQTVL